MKIIVCVKQVAKVYVRKGVDPQTNEIDPSGVVRIVNPFDEIAVEEAIRIKEDQGGEVTLVSFGPPETEDALRHCLAMGCDAAVHAVCEENKYTDPWLTAMVLHRVISKMNFDLIICGRQAIDDEMGLVGTYLAELLDLPVVTGVVNLELSDNSKSFVAQSALDKGNREEIEGSIPAVITVDKGLNKPRYAKFPDRKKAQQETITTLDCASMVQGDVLGKQMTHLVRYAPPKLRPKKIIAPDSNLSAAKRMSFVMSGGISKKTGGVVSNQDPEQIADKIMEYLKVNKFITT